MRKVAAVQRKRVVTQVKIDMGSSVGCCIDMIM